MRKFYIQKCTPTNRATRQTAMDWQACTTATTTTQQTKTATSSVNLNDDCFSAVASKSIRLKEVSLLVTLFSPFHSSKGFRDALAEQQQTYFNYRIHYIQTMRSDLLSKRLFFAGCFGLPWLWIVHILYWRTNEETNDQGIINPDDRK